MKKEVEDKSSVTSCHQRLLNILKAQFRISQLKNLELLAFLQELIMQETLLMCSYLLEVGLVWLNKPWVQMANSKM